MKKLITIMAAAASALFAFGGNDPGFMSGTSVEAYTGALRTDKNDAGTEAASTYWFLQGDENADLLVTNYESGVTLPPRPAKFDGDANNNFLKIDTTGRLYRSIEVNSTGTFTPSSIGDGIYLDTLVQFTAADDQFKADALAEGDKIAISYVERDADSVDEGEDPYTNFVVRAAYVDAANSRIVETNYFLTFPDQPANEVQFDKDAWHRLTVRAISNVGNEYAPVGFVVYVDGTNLVYDTSVAAGDAAYVDSLNSVVQTYLYNSETHSLLPSLMTSDDIGYDALAAVAFNGNGCVDDISFTATKPGILPSEGMTVTIAWDDNVTNCTVVAGETILINETVSGAGSTNLLLAAEITAITVTAGYAEGYEAGAWSASAGTLDNGVWTDLEGGATLTINSMLPLFDVGGVHYGSFAGALDAAVDASKTTDPWTSVTIKALADIDEGISFTDGDIVLDLNGRTLQGTVEEFTINNSGAILTIIDSASGGTVVAPSGDASRGALYMDDGSTVIDGGLFEGFVITQKMDEGDGADDLTLTGGVFADSLYDPDDEDAKFYLYDYLADGVKATYDAGYFTVGSDTPEPPAPTLIPVPPAATTLVYDGSEQTGVATGDGYTLGGTYAATNAGEYEATATPDAGYAWSDGTTHTTNISWSIAKATVTAMVSLTVTEATYDSTKTTVTDYTTPSVNFGLDAPALVENTDYTVGWSATEVSGAGTFTYTVSPVAESNYTFTEASVTLTITAGSSYPSYIDGHDDYKSAYETWASSWGADTSSAYEAEFLLNVEPGTDKTLEPASITISGTKVTITANKALDKVNGKVYIKTSATLAGLATATWSEASLDASGAIEMTSDGASAFFKIKVDF